jgi:hypothetical protein
MNYRNLSHYVVAAPFSATPAAPGIGCSLGYNTRWYVPQNGTTNTFVTYSTNNTHLSNANDTVNRLYSLVAGATTYTAYRNFTAIGTGPTVTATSDVITIGATGNGSFPVPFNGYVQEVIIVKGTNNVSEIQTDIINYYGL